MKKLIVTLAVAASVLASTAAAVADPGPNTCHRLRNAVASGTPISALPPRLLRRCFGRHATVRPAVATPVRPVREASVRPESAADVRPAAVGVSGVDR
jgi:hypothetical protein